MFCLPNRVNLKRAENKSYIYFLFYLWLVEHMDVHRMFHSIEMQAAQKVIKTAWIYPIQGGRQVWPKVYLCREFKPLTEHIGHWIRRGRSD